MLITKFNRMIRNKIVWGIFAAIVGFTFAFGSMLGGGGSDADKRRGAAGSLNGEDVSSRDFQVARYFELGMRERRGMTPEDNAILRDMTWKRLAALKACDELGLTVSPEETARVIQRDPTFQQNGVFSKDKYRQTIETQLRIGLPMFEDYVRQDILMRKLMQLMQAMIWAAPTEVTMRLQNLTDSFTVETGTITTNQLDADVAISTEDALAYFKENEEAFRTREQVSVRYVSFPIDSYTGQVSLTDEQISAYYDENLSDYSSTNALEDPTPLADVRDDISTLLSTREATFLAKDEATDFVMAMIPGRYTQGISLDKAAGSRELTIHTTDLFSASDVVPGISAPYDFSRVAFTLEKDDPDSSYSDPVSGDDAIYVLAAHDRVPPAIPAFEAVSNAVMAAVLAEARDMALQDRAQQIRDDVVQQIESGTTFTKAMSGFEINVSTSETFSIYDSSAEDLAVDESLIPQIMVLQQGSVSEAAPVADGLAIAYVTERLPGDIASAELLRPQLQSTISRYRANLVYADWGDYMLSEGDFEDYTALPVLDDEDGDEFE